MSFNSSDYECYYTYLAKERYKKKLKVRCDNCKCQIGHSRHPGPFGPPLHECVLCSMILCDDYRLCYDEECEVYVKNKMAYTVCSRCADDFDSEDRAAYEKKLEAKILQVLEKREQERREEEELEEEEKKKKEEESKEEKKEGK